MQEDVQPRKAGPDKPARKRRGRVRRVLRIGFLLLLLVAVVCVAMMRTPPKAWRANRDYLAGTTPEERAATASGVMAKLEALADEAARLAEAMDGSDGRDTSGLAGASGGGFSIDELNALDPDAARIDVVVGLDLTNAELSSLVTVWFDAWAEQRGFVVPTWFERPVVGAFGGELSMAFAASYKGWTQVFGGEVSLTFRDDGMAVGSVPSVTVGSLPVPVHEVAGALERDRHGPGDDTADAVGGWIARLESFEFRPVLELAHRRRARVIALEVGDGAVHLTVRLQDHRTYKAHNGQLASGEADPYTPAAAFAPAFADVPTDTD